MKQGVSFFEKNQQNRENFIQTKRQRENIQINKMRNKKGDTTDNEETQRIIRSYFKNSYPTIMESLKEMNSFLIYTTFQS
jgi:phosphopantetheine adenylyltransferase